MFKQKRIGIMGTGKIAQVMAGTVKKMKNVKCHGVASRKEERAQEFANEYGIKVAYTSYEEMLLDDKIDLVYIATPHSEHYANMKLCIEYGKNILCEKAFTANAKQAEEILTSAKKKGVFVAEAMWVRYMPMLTTIKGILNSGIIGEPTMLTANLGYNISDKKRLIDPALAGGALLDLGVYTLNFAAMMFGKEVETIDSSCILTSSGVDAAESITIKYKDGKMAVLNCTMNGLSDRRGLIYGSKGYIEIENINNFASVTVYDTNYKAVRTAKAPKQITGYEYEVYACMEAIEKGEKECWEMPHEETLYIMKQMDELRTQWGVVYPFENVLTGEVVDTISEETDIQA
ncbi:MAG: Gfo/Idh/MocA family oxidoreductase [Lachnospiraceae bacterium]|nr:Gfo/Idh/MocA family oxidoreductase [Lachnospiraceae bacterium]